MVGFLASVGSIASILIRGSFTTAGRVLLVLLVLVAVGGGLTFVLTAWRRSADRQLEHARAATALRSPPGSDVELARPTAVVLSEQIVAPRRGFVTLSQIVVSVLVLITLLFSIFGEWPDAEKGEREVLTPTTTAPDETPPTTATAPPATTATPTTATPTTTTPTTTTAATMTIVPKPVSAFDSSANFKDYEAQVVHLGGDESRLGLATYLVSCSGSDGDLWEFDVSRDYSRLTVRGGVSDRTNTTARMIFTVRGDGEVIFQQEAAFGEVVSIDLDISNVIRLSLQVQNTRNLCGTLSGSDDVGVFVDPRVTPVG